MFLETTRLMLLTLAVVMFRLFCAHGLCAILTCVSIITPQMNAIQFTLVANFEGVVDGGGPFPFAVHQVQAENACFARLLAQRMNKVKPQPVFIWKKHPKHFNVVLLQRKHCCYSLVCKLIKSGLL